MNPVRNNSNRTSIANEMREERRRVPHPLAGSAEKETAWTISIFFSITQSVPISVVVALTGENFGLVSLLF
jgi:hypothetical protein